MNVRLIRDKNFGRLLSAGRMALACAATLGAACARGVPGDAPAGVLTQVDSVRVQDAAALSVGRAVQVAATPSRTYIADGADARILEVGPDGAIVRALGRKGRGPGEFRNIGALALAGDSMLYAMDNGQKLVNVFDLRSGKFVRSFVLTAFLPQLAIAGDTLLASSYDPAERTSLITMSLDGAVGGHEGMIPAIATKLPMLLQPFPHIAFAVTPSTAYAVTELSDALFSWKRGERQGSEDLIPVARRRGVSDAKFEAMVRDPARAGAIAYDHSVPMVLGEIAPDMLALVTYDPVLEQGRFTGQQYLTLIDVRGRRACVDTPLPVPLDPLPWVTLVADQLVVVQQLNVDGAVATAVRRFSIHPSACTWAALK